MYGTMFYKHHAARRQLLQQLNSLEKLIIPKSVGIHRLFSTLADRRSKMYHNLCVLSQGFFVPYTKLCYL